MSAVRITILYNEPTLPADHPDADSEHDVLETVDVISKCLQAEGLAVSRFGATGDPQALLAGLTASRPDVVFNLFEGTAGWGQSEEYVAGLLELLKIPYTGCPTLPMTLCRNKPLAKRLFAGAGIPTAPYLVVHDGPLPPCPIPFPVIVKPGQEDASVGIDQKSVCQNQAELVDRVNYLRQTYGPSVLVERLIVGREFHVPVIEKDGQAIVLPFTEILFPPPTDGEPIWPIVTFDAKWKPNSRDFASTPAKNPAEVDDHLQRIVSEVVLRTFRLLDCRDYARVDLRVDEQGEPFVLEMNPNPCINPLAGVAAALESAKIPYPDFLLGCVRNALKRGGHADVKPSKSKSQIIASAKSRSAVTVEPVVHHSIISVNWQPFDSIMSASDQAFLKAILDKPLPSLSLAASQGDAIVGLMTAFPIDPDHGVWAIERLIVSGHHRRKGIGQSLLVAMEKQITTLGGRVIQMAVTSSPGFGAVRQFLGAFGYAQVGDCPEYFKDGFSRITYSKSFPAIQESTPVGVAETVAIGRAVTGGGLL